MKVLYLLIITYIVNKHIEIHHINLEDPKEIQYNFFKEKSEIVKQLNNKILVEASQSTLDMFEEIYLNILIHQDKQWLKEIKAISNIMELSFKDLLRINLMYEMYCTSLIIKKDKEIYMGRVLDWYDRELFKEIIFIGYYYKEGKLQYIAQGLYGYATFLNAIKIGKFSYSINQRNVDNNIIENLERISKGYSPTPFILKEIFEKSNDYKEAIQAYTFVELSSSIYIILINNKDGFIISRKYNDVVNVESMGENWFLVQTNSDRNEYCERREFAEKELKKIGLENIDVKKLQNKILFVHPVNNNDTIYITIQTHMNNGRLESIRYDEI